jgi:hypothetical protein
MTKCKQCPLPHCKQQQYKQRPLPQNKQQQCKQCPLLQLAALKAATLETVLFTAKKQQQCK